MEKDLETRTETGIELDEHKRYQHGWEYKPNLDLDSPVISHTPEEQIEMVKVSNRKIAFDRMKDILSKGLGVRGDKTEACKELFEMKECKVCIGYHLEDLEKIALQAYTNNDFKLFEDYLNKIYDGVEKELSETMIAIGKSSVYSELEHKFNFGLMAAYHLLNSGLTNYQHLLFLLKGSKNGIEEKINERRRTITEQLDAIKRYFKEELNIDPNNFKYGLIDKNNGGGKA